MRLDPNIQQSIASNPENSVWVGASAGTGKTKVLTDRLLRLLLPQENGKTGADPQKILCITFTKAAAGEMVNRLLKILSEWVTLPEKELKEALSKLTGKDVNENIIKAARQLFARVVDLPGGMKIQTIHSFCQSILQRFPIEAGLQPHFSLVTEREAKEILRNIQNDLLSADHGYQNKNFYAAVQKIIELKNEDQFFNLLEIVASERILLRELFMGQGGLGKVVANIYKQLEISPEDNFESLFNKYWQNDRREENLRFLQKITDGTGSNGVKFSEALGVFFLQQKADKGKAYHILKDAFLTQKNGIRQSVLIKKVKDQYTDAQEIFEREGEEILRLDAALQKVTLAQYSVAFMVVADEIISHYESYKRKHGVVDFDDQIYMTAKLLKDSNSAPWVLYKLDGGFDHILVDEAQDTNPIQWQVISALCEEFFAGDGRESREHRSLFVVGDKKQSIYSFQKADPNYFLEMQKFFAKRIEDAKKNFEHVSLDISFRSTQAVLYAVDQVFNDSDKGIGVLFDDQKIQHYSNRQNVAGLVELASFICEEDSDDSKSQYDDIDNDGDTDSSDNVSLAPWTVPLEIKEPISPEKLLAQSIAIRIKEWIAEGKMLPSKERPIQAGDIMILVRSRNQLYTRIAQALAEENIAFAGRDRVRLTEDLLVKDFLAFTQFALLPSDDFTLACLLRSPFINMQDENEIFDLCWNRKNSLWAEIKKKNAKLADYLHSVIFSAKKLKPYEFFDFLLRTPCPSGFTTGLKACLARRGDEIYDTLNMFMELVLTFEQTHSPNLQIFHQWMIGNTSDEKRETEESNGTVRLMTVHGAKGLQAPIVIMPEIISPPRSGQGSKQNGFIYWNHQDGCVLWSPSKDYDTDIIQQAKEQEKQADLEESRRLLYVAMTRAEDQLYMMAAVKGKLTEATEKTSWFKMVETALEKDTADGFEKVVDVGKVIGGVTFETLTLSQGQAEEGIVNNHHQGNEKRVPIKTLPKWCIEKPEQARRIKYSLNPSRLGSEEESNKFDERGRSPLSVISQDRFRRGIVIHRLLQYLPQFKQADQQNLVRLFLQTYAQDFKPDEQKEIVDEVLKVLSHADFAPAFSSESRAETAINGILKDGAVISGQVDRLVILPDRILIVDFKTNRPSPESVDAVPVIYLKQMAAYEAVLQAIYPERQVTSALLWTDQPHFMPLESEQLDPYRPAL